MHADYYQNILNDACEKDLWVNPINIVEVLEKFPVEKLLEIFWINETPINEWFKSRINRIIPEILGGYRNSLFVRKDL